MPQGHYERQWRVESNRVNHYLRGLAAQAEQPAAVGGRTLDQRLALVDQKLADNSLTPVQRLKLVQARLDLTDHQRTWSQKPLAELEADWVEIAADFSQRHGISYTAWRAMGVPATVLKRAGIRQTRTSPAAD